MKVLDLWEESRALFEGVSDDYPGIDFVNLAPEEMEACLLYLLQQAREITVNFRLAADPQVMVIASSALVAVDAFISGQIIGALGLDFRGMPSLVIYVQASDMFTVSFTRGEWDAFSVLFLFELLHVLRLLAPAADMLPDDVNFTYEERIRFMQIWQAYVAA